MNQAQAGCGPSWFKKTVPATGSFLLSDNKISFTFIGGGGTQQVVGWNISLYKSSNDSLVETEAISSTYPVGSSGNADGSFDFIISKKLQPDTKYYILMDAGSFSCRQYSFDVMRDSSGNPFTWNFTTATSPLTINSTGPAKFCQGESATLSVLKCFSYLWSTGETTQTIKVNRPGNYSLNVVYMNGCTASNIITLSSVLPNRIPICYVTVDSLSQNNIVRWDKTNLSLVDSFIVYREITTDNYQPVGAVPNIGGLSMFTDTTSVKYFPNTGNPNAGTYRYKLQIRDTCGNYSELSPYHNTIYMSNNNGTFSWNKLYSIEGESNPVNSYVLTRDDNSDGKWHAINSVTGTQFTVTDPAYDNFTKTAKWRIETLWGLSCSAVARVKGIAPSDNVSRSNARSAFITEKTDVALNEALKIYPNPSKGKFVIEMNEGLNAKVNIYNMLGELIYKRTVSSKIQDIDLTNLPPNIYFMQVKIGEKVYGKKVVVE